MLLLVVAMKAIRKKVYRFTSFRIPRTSEMRQKKRHKKWFDFVKLKRAKWVPLQYSIICSEHFKPDDFSRRFSRIEGQSFVGNVLRRDEFGICVFPTVMPAADALHVSDREKRMVCNLHFTIALLVYLSK